ncbi:MAG: 7TM diverse intracellular signaling domain-containing protein [Oligoflexus sp.]
MLSRLLVATIILCLPIVSYGDVVVIDEALDRLSINQHLFFMEDRDHTRTLSEVRNSTPGDLWHKNESSQSNFGFKHHPFWFRFHLQSDAPDKRRVYLELDYPLIDKLDIYVINQDELTQTLHSGDHLPFSSRFIKHANYIIPLDLEPHTPVEIYLRLQSEGPLRIPLLLWSDTALFEKKQSETTGILLYYGIMFAMVAYNTFLFFTLADREHLYYVLYTVSFMLYQASFNGLAPQYLWPNSPYLSEYSIQIFQALSGTFIILFTQGFLRINRSQAFLYFTMITLLLLGGATCMSAFLANYQISLMMSLAFSGLSAIFLMLASVLRLLDGYRPARFYVIAFSCFFIGVIGTALSAFGVFRDQFFTIYGAQIGSALEVVLLSIALGDKIRIDQLEKNRKIQTLNRELQDKIVNIERIVQYKTQEIQSIMECIEIGIFTMDRDFKIRKGHSRHLAVLAENQTLDGYDALSLILERTDIENDRVSQLRAALDCMFGESILSFHMNRHLLLNEITKNCEIQCQIVWELDWLPIESESGTIEYMLVTIRDVTERRELKRKVSNQEHELIILTEISRVKPGALQKFLDQTQKLLERYQVRMKEKKIGEERLLVGIEACVHTIKGNARSLNLIHLSSKIHDIEEMFRRTNRLDSNSVTQIFQEVLLNLAADLELYQRVSHDFYKLARSSESISVHVIPSEIRAYMRRLQQLNIKDRASIIDLRNDLLHDFSRLCFIPVKKILGDIDRNVDLLAKELGKQKARLQVSGEENLAITHEAYEALNDVLIHLSRNSMDHGIEDETTRTQKGKPSTGVIAINFEVDNKHLKIKYRDDGSGIDIKKILQKAISKQFIEDTEELSDMDIANLIFLPGLSTASQVTQISGRGVGMGAVAEILEEVGGQIQIELLTKLKPYYSFQFVILLPIELSYFQGSLPISA